MLCRLTPSLCLNFLCLAHLDSHMLPSTEIPLPLNSTAYNETSLPPTLTPPPSPSSPHYETAFTAFMGHLDVVGVIAGGFNVYFPMTVVILCLFTLLRLGSRLLACLGMPQLIDASANFSTNRRQPEAGEPNAVDDAIEDGRMLLYRGGFCFTWHSENRWLLMYQC